jgi:hypothetical protein
MSIVISIDTHHRVLGGRASENQKAWAIIAQDWLAGVCGRAKSANLAASGGDRASSDYP